MNLLISLLLWLLRLLGYSPPLHVASPHHEKAWLVATAGECTRFAQGRRSDGVVNMSFAFQPRTYIRFTDYPYHVARVFRQRSDMVRDLSDPGWSHRNVALVFGEGDVHQDISIYEINVHREDDGAVFWSGDVVAQTFNGSTLDVIYHDAVNATEFECSLFVDSFGDDVPECASYYDVGSAEWNDCVTMFG